MMQGDSYDLAIRVRNNAGNPVTPADITDMEITIGHIRKTYLKAELRYMDGWWLFHVSQKESFRLLPGAIKAEIRVKWSNGIVEGKPLHGVRIEESTSKEVL